MPGIAFCGETRLSALLDFEPFYNFSSSTPLFYRLFRKDRTHYLRIRIVAVQPEVEPDQIRPVRPVYLCTAVSLAGYAVFCDQNIADKFHIMIVEAVEAAAKLVVPAGSEPGLKAAGSQGTPAAQGLEEEKPAGCQQYQPQPGR